MPPTPSFISLDPKYFPPRLNLAYSYERADRIEDAMAAYREAINFQPRNFFAHNNLGVLYDKKGLHDAAIREFEIAVVIEPENTMALRNFRPGFFFIPVCDRLGYSRPEL
jgi:Tfp pilus assembly protein PilF